jgi:hypothetical protein
MEAEGTRIVFKVPKKLTGLGGVITVMVEGGLKVKGEKVHGYWNPRSRTIKLAKGNTPHEMEHTFYHEQMHAALDDSGQWNLLTKEGAEALCDLVATMRMREQYK